ncbi:MAG TPA: hypothetical protein VE544_01710 [Nitrososphaeraceae archaeon]|nr:hypothetical protein [Nitrososphaeraceae archaeon]
MMRIISSQETKEFKITRKVVVKVMITENDVTNVFDFLENVKNMEIGGALKSIRKDENGWWTCDSPVGKAKVKITHNNRELGVLDHVFAANGIEWKVHVRIVPNKNGSTTTWIFTRPDELSEEEFEAQLKGFDSEIAGWKSALSVSI